MPDLTMASAISRIMSSLTLHPNLFQLFQPMGGVAARVVCWAARKEGLIATAKVNRHSALNLIRGSLKLLICYYIQDEKGPGVFELPCCVDSRTTSLGAIDTRRGRSVFFDPICSINNSAACLPICLVP